MGDPTLEAIRAELLDVRARVDRALALLPLPMVANEPTVADPKWMKINDYARRWSMSRSALYARIADGLPTDGSGHNRRILVAEADAWMRKRAPKSA